MERLVILLLGAAGLAGLSLLVTWLARRRLLSLASVLTEARTSTSWLSSSAGVEGRFEGRPASVRMGSRSDPGLTITLELDRQTFPFELLRATRTSRVMNAALAGKGQVRQVGQVLIGPLGDPEACTRWLDLPGNLEAVERLMNDGKVDRLQSSGRLLIAHTERISRGETEAEVAGILRALRNLSAGL